MNTKSKKSQREIILFLFIFSAAMAFLESAVVIYLRALYYPEGFTVALRFIDDHILLTEILREAATIIMLWGIAYIAGKNFIQRFSYFLFCFAIWDLFYYVWLKVLIQWPESWFTWDILFLIPFTWLGPVLAPIICSITMILLSLTLLHLDACNLKSKIQKVEWTFLTIGSSLILVTFLQDYALIIFSNGWFGELDTLMQNSRFLELTSTYIPTSYNWLLFSIGEIILLLEIAFIWIREYKITYNIYKRVL
jgi:hypothetical protein